MTKKIEPGGEGGPDRRRIALRVRRVAGQVAGIQRMLDEGCYCINVLHQIAAVRAALDAAGLELISAHLESCVVGSGGTEPHRDAAGKSNEVLLKEVRRVIRSFLT